MLARHIARTVAEQAGWRASFSPVVTEDLVGNGAHAHFSAWRDDETQFCGGGTDGVKARRQAFLAGVLDHISALRYLAKVGQFLYLAVVALYTREVCLPQ